MIKNNNLIPTYTIKDIDELITAVKYTLEENDSQYLREKLFDFKSCYNVQIHGVGLIYLEYLESYKEKLVNGKGVKFTAKDVSETIEKIKDYISNCGTYNIPITTTVVERDVNFKDNNPDYPGDTAWERDMNKTPSSIVSEDHYEVIDCNVEDTSTVTIQGCKVDFKLIHEINNYKINPCNIEFKGELENKDCIITDNGTLNLNDCIIEHKELFKTYNCNLSLTDYLKINTCGVNFDLVAKIYSCGYSLEYDASNQCPLLVIDNKIKLNMCEMSFTQESINKSTNKNPRN